MTRASPRSRQGDDRIAQLEERPRGQMLRPQLQEPRAAVEERLGKIDCPPAGLRGDVGIDNGLSEEIQREV